MYRISISESLFHRQTRHHQFYGHEEFPESHCSTHAWFAHSEQPLSDVPSPICPVIADFLATFKTGCICHLMTPRTTKPVFYKVCVSKTISFLPLVLSIAAFTSSNSYSHPLLLSQTISIMISRTICVLLAMSAAVASSPVPNRMSFTIWMF